MRRLILVASLLLVPSVALAQKTTGLNTSNVQNSYQIEFACEGTNCVGKTVDATAGGVTLTAATYNPTVTDQPAGFSQAQAAFCTNTGAKIWVTSTPSTVLTLASGRDTPIQDGQGFWIYGFTNIQNFRAIRDAAVSSTLLCAYYRQP